MFEIQSTKTWQAQVKMVSTLEQEQDKSSDIDIDRISNEFSFHTMYYETSCVFYIPEPLERGYKTQRVS